MIGGTRSGWVATGILVAVFGAGALAGAAVMETRHTDRSTTEVQRSEDAAPRSEGPTRMGRTDRFVRYIKSRLELTDSQEAEIRDVLLLNEKESHELYESIRPALEAGVTETRDEIRSLLTPEQVRRFDKILTDERGRRRRNSGSDDRNDRTTPRGERPSSETPPGGDAPESPRAGADRPTHPPAAGQANTPAQDPAQESIDEPDGEAVRGERLGPVMRV